MAYTTTPRSIGGLTVAHRDECDETHTGFAAGCNTARPTQVIISDDAEQERGSGDEQHVFYVFAADDEGDAIGDVQTLHSAQAATDYAAQWAKRLGVQYGWD